MGEAGFGGGWCFFAAGAFVACAVGFCCCGFRRGRLLASGDLGRQANAECEEHFSVDCDGDSCLQRASRRGKR